MSDEQRKEETDVEGHVTRWGANDDETTDEGENEVEAHIRYGNVRMDAPRET